MDDSIYISYLENKHYKKIRKSDEPVVFTARKGAVRTIVFTLLLGALVACCFTAPFELDGAWLRWPLGILFSLVIIWALFLSFVNLNARVVLTKESISMTGRVLDFEDGALADFKASIRQLFLVKRHVEIKWSEIEKLCRPGSTGSGLYFYTKSGQRYFLNTGFFDMKLMPTIKRYKKYERIYRWW